MLRSSRITERRTTTGARDGEDEETFKVTDRRGRVKEEFETPRPTESAASRPPALPLSSRDRRPQPNAQRPDLQGIFVMLASSALISLGEAVDPVTRERRADLEQAREAIDMLLVLRDKTSGNRTEQEDQLLEELVYDLQMRFVRAADAQRSR